jgi:hypothetical protein
MEKIHFMFETADEIQGMWNPRVGDKVHGLGVHTIEYIYPCPFGVCFHYTDGCGSSKRSVMWLPTNRQLCEIYYHNTYGSNVNRHVSLLSLAFFMEKNPDEKIGTFTELLLRFVMYECFNSKWDTINKVWI